MDVSLWFLLLWLAVLVVLKRRHSQGETNTRRIWYAAFGVWAVAWIFSTPFASLALIRAWEFEPETVGLLSEQERTETAIVVLGSSTRPPTPGDTAPERLDSAGLARTLGAARVWRSTQAGAVIVSGRALGPVPSATGEAMREFIVLLGVPRERVVIEPWSLNTRQNIENSARLGRRLGFTRFVIVTSAVHMRRAQHECTRAGVRCIPAPVDHETARYFDWGDLVPVSWGWAATNSVVHEVLGMAKP
jgi:uncharacterized SAM-binding protein YcdF (DUF218 family)